MATRRLSLANLLTLARLLTVPLLLVAAVRGAALSVVLLLAFALLTDVLDGPVARALGQASTFGARLDSSADCALYLAAPLAAILLHPYLLSDEPATLVTLALGYGVPIGLGLVKYRRLIAYHTRASKVAGVLFGAAGLCFLLSNEFWPVRIAAIAVAIAGSEEAMMTWLLPEWRSDVRGLGAADGRRRTAEVGDGRPRAATNGGTRRRTAEIGHVRPPTAGGGENRRGAANPATDG